MALSAYVRDRLLDHYLRGEAFPPPANIYASAHTADPGLTGADEVVGGSYGRVLVSAKFGVAAGGAKPSNSNVDFTLMPAVTVTHVGIWDAWPGGNFIVGGPLADPTPVAAGDTLRLTAGQLVATLS